MKLVSLALVSTVACSGSASTAPDAAAGPSACSAARAQLLGAVNSVSTGNVTVLSSSGGATTLYVDASAGGVTAPTAPWVFVSLGGNAKVSVTDTTSVASTGWDLALKRPALYTNDGDGGPGQGGAVLIQKDFASVTAADASSAAFATEKFFDTQCDPMIDPIGGPLTTFSTWYDYNQTTHVLTPAAGTWLVRGATGARYKLRIGSYYSTPDGNEGTGDGGTFKIEVGAL